MCSPIFFVFKYKFSQVNFICKHSDKICLFHRHHHVKSGLNVFQGEILRVVTIVPYQTSFFKIMASNLMINQILILTT